MSHAYTAQQRSGSVKKSVLARIAALDKQLCSAEWMERIGWTTGANRAAISAALSAVAKHAIDLKRHMDLVDAINPRRCAECGEVGKRCHTARRRSVQRKLSVLRMHRDGVTYKEIAGLLGVTAGLVGQLIAGAEFIEKSLLDQYGDGSPVNSAVLVGTMRGATVMIRRAPR